MISWPADPDPPRTQLLSVDEAIAALIESGSPATLALVRSLIDGAPLDRAALQQLDTAIEADRGLAASIDLVASEAARAQELFANWSDDAVDRLLADLAETFADAAGDLAEATVRETGMGNARDKTLKNRFASLGILESLPRDAKDAPGGNAVRGVTEVLSPVGVVLGIVPVTNPVATAMFKTLIALKARNALILSFHRRAHSVGRSTAAIIRDVLEAHGAPAALVQVVGGGGGRRATRKLMEHPLVSLILATGGSGLVKAAYSSGKPAIGVGPGNAPAWICADADPDRAAAAIVASKTFDNGLICGAEHNLVVDDRVAAPFVAALESRGTVVLAEREAAAFAAVALDDHGQLRHEFVGRSAGAIANALGIVRTDPPRLLIVRTAAGACGTFFGREKLAPVLSLFVVSGEDEGLRLSRRLLQGPGAGHTAVIHTTNAARIDRFARAMPAARILVNSPAAQGCCGMTTGLDRSLTLGCGTFGGNSTTDNIGYRHLVNVKRVARCVEEVWR